MRRFCTRIGSSVARRIKAESGMALFGVVVLANVMLLLTLSVLSIGAADAGLAAKRGDKSAAFYLAEGGLAKGMAWLEAQAGPPGGTEKIMPFGEAADTIGCGSYTVSVTPDSMNGFSDRPRYTILSTGHVDGETRTLELKVRQELLTDFLYFTDQEIQPGVGNPLWFTDRDVIDGPLFSNDQLSIHGNPTFKYHVTSAYGGVGDNNDNHTPSFLYYNGDSNNHIESDAQSNAPYDTPQFLDGYTLGADQVEYPTLAEVVLDARTTARRDGISLAGVYDIELARPDDDTGEPMYGYVSYKISGKETWTDVEISSFNGLLFVNGSCTVSGVLDGQLTIATNGQLWITDDVTYRDSGPDGPNEYCDDMLGLVAGSDIIVDDTEPNMDDCVVHAAMISLDNCFKADNYNSGPPRGNLTVYGSIVQSFRGPIGSSEPGEDGDLVVRSGYDKDYHFDWRLQEPSPPHFYEFFGGTQYAQVRWREVPESYALTPLE